MAGCSSLVPQRARRGFELLNFASSAASSPTSILLSAATLPTLAIRVPALHWADGRSRGLAPPPATHSHSPRFLHVHVVSCCREGAVRPVMKRSGFSRRAVNGEQSSNDPNHGDRVEH